MKVGWQRKKIAEIAEHSLGKMLDRAKNRGEPRSYLRNVNVRWFEFDLSDVLEMRFLPSEFARYTAQKGDVLVCEGGYPGRAAIWDRDEPVYFQKALHRVRFHRPEHNKWFLYYLHAKDLDGTLKRHFSGAGIQHFTGEALAQFELPLPSVPELQRIVGILDEAFAGIATVKAYAGKSLQCARSLFNARRNAAFVERGEQWVEASFADVCQISSTLVDPRRDPYRDMTHVGGANIVSGTGELVELKTAQQEWLTSGKFVFDSSMVLYNKIRPYLMKVARPDFRGLCSADIYPLSPKPGRLNRDYLFHLLSAQTFTHYAIAGSARAGMPKVNRDHLFAFRTYFPPVAEQQQLAKQLDALSAETQRLENIYQRKLAALDELKQSLLHQAFTGELTSSRPVVIPFPRAARAVSTTDLHAGILAIAYQLHEQNDRARTFGHVKAEKIAHMIEAHLGIDLGREPVKDAAGPNDFRRLKHVEQRAHELEFFEFARVDGLRYSVTKHANFDQLVARARASLGDRNQDVDRLLELMLPMDTRQAEIVTTVYAAWNNLLLGKQAITDESIVREARENWHPDKLRIARDKFFKAITWMRDKGITPAGRGKRVPSKLGRHE